MSQTPQHDILEQIDDAPFGPELRSLIAEAIRQAEESGDNELAYAARMRLTNVAYNMGDYDAVFSSFAWCLGMHDSDPVTYPYDTDGGDLLWQFKWVSSSLGVNPLFPVEKIQEIHADMERRYREAGFSQSGVLQSKMGIAVRMGNLDEARRLLDERNLIERDDYSHCEACVRGSDAWFYQATGNDDEAIRLYDDLFANNLTCGDEPERSEAEALLPYLRAGRLDDARAAHLRSYRASRGKLDGIGIINDHLVFCAVTGNEARGLAMLERHLDQVAAEPLNLLGHFESFTAMAVLLDAVTRAGHGDQIVRGADAPRLRGYLGERDTSWTVDSLAAACWAAAEGLADQFNSRNNNTHFTTRVATARALASEHYDVRIESDSFRAPEPVAAEPVTAEDWLARAEAAVFSGELDALQAAVSAGLALAENEASAVTHSNLWALRSTLYTHRGENELAADAARTAHATLREAGWVEYADAADAELVADPIGTEVDASQRLAAQRERLVAARAGGNVQVLVSALLGTAAAAMRVGSGEGSEATSDDDETAAQTRAVYATEAEALTGEAVVLAAQDDPLGALGNARLRHAEALLALDRLDDAVTELDILLADESVSAYPRLVALDKRVRTAAAQGDTTTAIARADDLLNEFVAHGLRSSVIQAADFSAYLLSEAGREEEAVQRARYALTQAELAESPRVHALRSTLGRYLLFAGHPMEALEQLDVVYRALGDDESASAVDLASILYWLGAAALNSEEHGLAYGAWSRALPLLADAEAPGLLNQVGLALTTLLMRFQDEEAIEVAETTLASARATQNAELIGGALHKLGTAQTQFEREDAVDSLTEARLIAEGLGSPEWAADILDDTARALGALGRTEEAVSTALQAADALAQAGLLPNAGAAEHFAATMLVDTDAEAAIGLFRSAQSRFEEGSQNWITMSIQLADALEGVGRHGEASQVRATIIPVGDEPPAQG